MKGTNNWIFLNYERPPGLLSIKSNKSVRKFNFQIYGRQIYLSRVQIQLTSSDPHPLKMNPENECESMINVDNHKLNTASAEVTKNQHEMGLTITNNQASCNTGDMVVLDMTVTTCVYLYSVLRFFFRCSIVISLGKTRGEEDRCDK